MELTNVFVGRSRELQTIDEMRGLPESGGVLISAPSGTGKSRLAREALSHAAAEGHPTAAVRASVVSQRVPLGALSAAPELGIAEHTSTLTPLELADLCVATLNRHSSGRRFVLLVDDAHLLDDMSLLVIERLASSEHVFLILTARTGEGEFATLQDMGTEGLVRTLPLPPLDREEAKALVERSLAGAVDGALTRQLFEHSAGNPLFLLELLRGSLESEALTQGNGIWRLRGALNASQRVREVVQSRLRGLSAQELGLLELIAIVDRMNRQVVEHFSSIETLQELETRGLVSTTLEHRQLSASLAHPIYGDVLRSGLSGLRTQLATQALADYLERQPGLSDSECLQVAALRLVSGSGDPQLMARAAQIAINRHDLDLALECVDAVVEIDGGIGSRLLRARILSHRGQFSEADLELVGCLDLASTDEQLAEAAVLRLDFLTFYQGHIEDALRFAADVEARIADPNLRQTVAVRRVGALLHTDGPRAVADAVEPLLTTGASEVESWACMLASWAYFRLGKFGEALEISLRGEAAQETRSYPTDWYPELHSVVRCYVHAGAGELQAARTTAREALLQASEDQASDAVGGYSLFLASLARDCGHTDEALRHAHLAESIYRSSNRDVYLADSIVHRAVALAIAGRGDEAFEALDKLEGANMPDYWYFSPELYQARAWASAANQLRQQAKAEFVRSASIGARTGDLVGALTAWHGCARIGYPRPALEPMKRIARQTDSALAQARLHHVAGLVAHDAARLQEASEQFEAMGADLLAAEAAVAAATSLIRRGAGRAGEQWQRRATAMFRRQDGSITAILQPRTVEDLTAAEAATARLAAQGRSNTEIADMLGLSVRTVENRLQRVYIKMGVSSRQALADLGV